jgi:DinB family protein
MGAKAEALARRFEAKAAEVTALIEQLSDRDWQKVTAAEKWPVGVVAHHIAVAHEVIASIAKSIADGTPQPPVSTVALDAINAKHAADHAHVTKAETLAQHEKKVALAAAMVRQIADSEFDRKAPVMSGRPPMSVRDVAGGLLIRHIDEHLRSIRATVGS